MKKIIVLLLFFIVLAITSQGEEASASSAVKTWNTKKGKTIEAEFVKSSFGMVYFKDADGKDIKVSLSSLTKEDQDLIKEQSKAAMQARMKKLRSKSSSSANSGILSDEEIANLKVTHQDELHDRSYTFAASFYALKLDPKRDKSTIKKYASSGKIPIRITCSLREVMKKSSTMISGTARFYILDSEGNVVLKKSESLNKMCPS
ncbi:SHD1 domain-containing protein [Verrucomicrobiota bacterium]